MFQQPIHGGSQERRATGAIGSGSRRTGLDPEATFRFPARLCGVPRHATLWRPSVGP